MQFSGARGYIGGKKEMLVIQMYSLDPNSTERSQIPLVGACVEMKTLRPKSTK